MIATHLTAFLLALLLSFLLTLGVRSLALRRGWVALPDSKRHLHAAATPRLGGVAIVLSFLAVTGLLFLASRAFGFDLGFSATDFVIILVPALTVFLVGLVDDIFSLPAWVKFAFQALAAAMLFFGGLQVARLPLVFGFQELGWLTSLLLTIFWVLLITNAFNLIDGLDGLAAGAALFATVTIFVVAASPKVPVYLVSLLTIVLAGAILGFLRFNFNPATVFLGDCGSLFLGFVLSALALAGHQKSTAAVAVAIPVVSFGLPILDTLISVVRRFISGQPLFRADRQHIHHKLLERGLSQRQAVMLLYGVSALFGVTSLLLVNLGGKAIGLALVVVGAVIWLSVQHLGYHEFFELKRVARRTVNQKRIMINNLAIRRGIEELTAVEGLPQLCAALRHCFSDNDFDAFRLTVLLESRLPALPPEAGLDCADRELSFCWNKGEGDNGSSASPARCWSLNLDLLDSAQRPCGRFQVYRSYGPTALLFDVNMLTTAFPAALAGAVERALQGASRPSVVADPAHTPALQQVPGSKAG